MAPRVSSSATPPWGLRRTTRSTPTSSVTVARRRVPLQASPTGSSTTGPLPDSPPRPPGFCARPGLVAPSVRSATGSGTQRLYSFRDILVLKVVKRLLDTGVSLQNIRKAVDHLRNRGIKDLANVTLFSDGATVYECTSAEEVVDLLAGGQGVFGIAVSGALRELSGDIAELPAERIDGGPVRSADDELSQRRRRRAAV